MDTSKTIGIAFCLAFATSVVCKPVDINGGGSTNLVAVGSIEGKTFFADPTARSWTVAKTFCADMGMQLARITSQPQWDLLISAAAVAKYTGDHWTAARDSQVARQFTWDGTTVQPAYGAWTNHGNAYQTCGSLDPATGHRNMHLELCTTAHKVLCETIV